MKKRKSISVPPTRSQRVAGRLGTLADAPVDVQSRIEDYEIDAFDSGNGLTASEMAWALGRLPWRSDDPRSMCVFFDRRDDALTARANLLRKWPAAAVVIYARPCGWDETQDGPPEREDCVPDADGVLVPTKAWFARNGILVEAGA